MYKFTINLLIILFLFVFFIFIFSLRINNKIALGNSCFTLKKEIIYSPDKEKWVEIQPYLCGLFQNKYITLRIYSKHAIFVTDINENKDGYTYINSFDIDWPTRPWSTKFDKLPKVIWKNNQQVDIYVKTRVRFGIEKKHEDNKNYDKKNGEPPFNAFIHYQRQS